MDIKKLPEQLVFGLDIGTRSIVGTVGYKQNEEQFVVVAQTVRFHETRAMMDGQIHDILKVSETIADVRRDLERQIGRKLTRVCIAAAGRVLKTVTVRVEENSGDENFNEEIITHETIHSLEMIGIEKAYDVIRKETQNDNIEFYCVGYTVVHYYLNDNMITNLDGHKGNKIAAEILATFLPEEVIDGLYAAVEKAGLEVDNLTLEPIAAINVAIPEKFRLLNIALVDVGAGTSDICITKEGTIVAYGMIPAAGDAITDVIVQKHLVDFDTAEKIKLDAASKKKQITYKDIMGLPAKTTPNAVLELTKPKVTEITKKVADRIMELNGGKSVSAVFVVGGGGKLPTFTKMLATHLKLPQERVALRGEEVLGAVVFPDDVEKTPELVTPIGICLNYYEKKNNFIFVQANGERVKLYDNSKLTVLDAAMAIGFPNDGLFPKRGTPLEFTINGKQRLVRGTEGEAAQITLNSKPASINTPIEANDVIEIISSTAGAPAEMTVGQLPMYRSTIEFIVNGKTITCPKFIRANDELVSEYYDIKSGDNLEIQDYYTLRQLLDFMDVGYKEGILVNHVPADENEKVYERFSVDYRFDFSKSTSPVAESFDELPEPEAGDEIKHPAQTEAKDNADASENQNGASGENSNAEEAKPTEPIEIKITVNQLPVTLKGKTSYVVVDVLDYCSFDVNNPQGSRVVIRVNGENAGFSTPLTQGAFVELYWEK